ncbi:hypothetical protein A2U01_0092608, partial [Trifolium medium]|nr:hypothetical protein [Trifolium medium]
LSRLVLTFNGGGGSGAGHHRRRSLPVVSSLSISLFSSLDLTLSSAVRRVTQR